MRIEEKRKPALSPSEVSCSRQLYHLSDDTGSEISDCACLRLAVPGCAWLCLAVPGVVPRAVPGCALCWALAATATRSHEAPALREQEELT